MRIAFNGFKPFHRGKDSGLFASKASIELLEREKAARIEADHDRAGWW